MDATNWVKQADQPAFADLFWSQPQNRTSAGKLLIVGGSSHSFSALSQAYAAAVKAGVGTARVLAPAALHKSLAKVFPEAQFAPSTTSGNFGRSALAEIMDNTAWADGVLLAGDFGNNSETTALLESLLEKYSGPLVLAGDTVDYLGHQTLLSREKTTLVIDFSRLQKLAAQSGIAVKHLSDLMQLTIKLTEWERNASLVTIFQDFIVASTNKRVSTTSGSANLVELAAYCAVWQIQQSTKIFESLTSAAYCYARKI